MTTDTQARPRSEAERDELEAAVAGPPPQVCGPVFSVAGLFAPRGRHRRPRHHRLLLVAGLALAIGALSLVRLAHDPGAGGAGTTQAGPRPDPGTGSHRATNTAASAAAAPEVRPSAASIPGGAGTAPATRGTQVVPARSATSATAPKPLPPAAEATTVPEAPDPPAAPTRQSTAPRPTPPRSPATPSPSRTPGGAHVCVPVIGLCVDTPSGRD